MDPMLAADLSELLGMDVRKCTDRQRVHDLSRMLAGQYSNITYDPETDVAVFWAEWRSRQRIELLKSELGLS